MVLIWIVTLTVIGIVIVIGISFLVVTLIVIDKRDRGNDSIGVFFAVKKGHLRLISLLSAHAQAKL